MYLLMGLSFVTTVFFGLMAITLSIKAGNATRELEERDESKRRKLYEASVLKTVQDRIGYSLDVEHVTDAMLTSLKNLFPYSTVSAISVHDDRLIFKISIEDRISAHFLQEVKKRMVEQLESLTKSNLPTFVEEIRQGQPVDEEGKTTVASITHVPLVVNGQVVGMITLASAKDGLYRQEDMTMLYQMANQTSSALSKLKGVIQAEENKLIAMIGSIADGIFTVDSSMKLTLINDTAKQLLSITSQNPTIFEVISALSKKYDFGKKLQESIMQNHKTEEREMELGDKVVQIVITPVLASPNPQATEPEVLGAAVTLHDITLEKTLAKLKEEFTSAVVHELRSPLTAIKAGSELILSQKNKIDSMQEEKMLGIINKQSERMLHDINSLLDATKLESGHFTLSAKPASIQEVIEETVGLFESEAKKKQIGIAVDIEKELPLGMFDNTRIAQVLNNLISNSLKFTPENGIITIKAHTYSTDYLPKTQTNPGILISVADSGIGIPKEKQAVLFQKFSQVENAQELHNVVGTGLGLYISKGIVEAHGGSIFLQSTPGKGTTVSFTLPVAQSIGIAHISGLGTAIVPAEVTSKVVN
ncbi:MAG: GAF domain-containing sensor histidine kinase [Patescibacteria group bacterium]|nr:GAF domain-containing sensor histidine kinase [Patescibacteria group bacterium]MDE2588097.1 GAF domain-containing sensor histidine kinase [Patescibacteria group bacterium]